MIEKQIGIATIFALVVYFLYVQLQKFKAVQRKKHKSRPPGASFDVTHYYKFAFSFLFQRQEMLLFLLAIVTVSFLIPFPSWLQYQKYTQSEPMFSIFAAQNPYQVWSLFYPENWSYVFSGFFGQVARFMTFLLFTMIPSITTIGFRPIVLIASLITTICISFVEPTFLLWLKEQLHPSKKPQSSLLQRTKILFPQFFLFHFVTASTFTGLGLLNLKTVNLFLAISTTTPDEVPTLFAKMGVSFLILIISLVFLVVPIILVRWEEKNIWRAFDHIKEFFSRYYREYFLFILLFFIPTTLLTTINSVTSSFLPVGFLKSIAPWTYSGLSLELLENIFIVFVLGWFTIALVKLVHELQ